MLESIAVLTVAVAALELGQTILEEEVHRQAQMSAPTRVRRFLSRFMVVLVVALSIETLVLVFRMSQDAARIPAVRREPRRRRRIATGGVGRIHPPEPRG